MDGCLLLVVPRLWRPFCGFSKPKGRQALVENTSNTFSQVQAAKLLPTPTMGGVNASDSSKGISNKAGGDPFVEDTLAKGELAASGTRRVVWGDLRGEGGELCS